MYSYKTSGVCASTINLEIEENIIKSVEFIGGCSGNLQGIGQLVTGMNVDDVITKLTDIHCKTKPTSCPDQLAKALLKWKSENN